MVRADPAACPAAGTNKASPPPSASRMAKNRTGRPGCPANRSDEQSRRPGNGTKRARIGRASGYTDRSFRPDAVRYMSVTTATYRPAVTHPDIRRDKKETARRAAFPQPAGRFRRWWQVLGSNQRRLSRRFYRPPQLRSVYGLWPAVTLPGSIDGDFASHVCPTQRGFGLRSWTVSLGSLRRCIAATC
jgi:hypothetical protein